jgi:hypothetical protein
VPKQWRNSWEIDLVPIKLFLDEDVWTGLAFALREAGYDAVSANDVGRKGLSDEEQIIER